MFLGCNDTRHRKLAESYAALNRDYEHLKLQYRDILLVHEGVCAETKLLKKALVALQSLVSVLFILPDFLEQQFFAFIVCCKDIQLVSNNTAQLISEGFLRENPLGTNGLFWQT